MSSKRRVKLNLIRQTEKSKTVWGPENKDAWKHNRKGTSKKVQTRKVCFIR